jgi:nucleoside-diphosphate-sugar epimerase
VKLNMDAATARRSSVSTTVHILRLAEEASSLEKLEYLSTVGVAGTLRGPISERKIDEPRTFHNTYESSKAEAELVVWEAMGRGLPVTIHRPSMVVGDSRDGRTLHFQVFYHLMEFLSGRATGGWVPRLPHFRLDVVPNDYVARALAASIRNPGWAGQVLHLSAGRDGSWPLDRYVETLPALFSGGGLPTLSPHRFPWAMFRFLVPFAAFLGPAHRRKSFRNLPRFLSYLRETTYFDNQNACRLLGAIGVGLPVIGEFLPRVMDRYTRGWSNRNHNL